MFLVGEFIVACFWWGFWCGFYGGFCMGGFEGMDGLIFGKDGMMGEVKCFQMEWDDGR